MYLSALKSFPRSPKQYSNKSHWPFHLQERLGNIVFQLGISPPMIIQSPVIKGERRIEAVTDAVWATRSVCHTSEYSTDHVSLI